MVPQQAEIPAFSIQQTEVPASRPPVEATPVPNTNRTRTPPVDEVPVIFDGDDRTCTICQEELEDGESVVRKAQMQTHLPFRMLDVCHGQPWSPIRERQ